MKKGVKYFFLASLLSASIASAEVEIGNGFTCSGDTILKGTKEVSFSKAKSTLQKTLEKLKKKLSTASPKNKAAIKEAIKAANNSKTLIKACSNGTLDSGQTESIFAQLASGSGTYSGAYNATVSSPIGNIPIAGDVTMQFTLDGTSFSAILTLGGNLGSALDAKPLTFTADVGGIAFPAQITITGTFIGDVTLSITKEGALTITNSNSSTGPVTFNGQFSENKITSTLSGSYKGTSFQGSGTLTRQ